MVICGGHHTIRSLVGEVWVSYDHFYILVDTYIVDTMLLAEHYVVWFYYYTIALCRMDTTKFATDIQAQSAPLAPSVRQVCEQKKRGIRKFQYVS